MGAVVSSLTPEQPDRAVARVLAGGLADPVRVHVDLGQRDRAVRVHATFDDCDVGRVPQVTDLVIAEDERAGIEVPAIVEGVDEGSRRLILAPLWHLAASRMTTLTSIPPSARSIA